MKYDNARAAEMARKAVNGNKRLGDGAGEGKGGRGQCESDEGR